MHVGLELTRVSERFQSNVFIPQMRKPESSYNSICETFHKTVFFKECSLEPKFYEMLIFVSREGKKECHQIWEMLA